MTRAARFWPIAIVVLLAANVAGTVVMIRASGGEDANAVEPDYYRKSMAWDSIATARQQAAALGWTLRAQLGPLDAQGVAALDVTLLDRDGAPIDDALLGVEAIHNAHARHPVSATLAATAAGRSPERCRCSNQISTAWKPASARRPTASTTGRFHSTMEVQPNRGGRDRGAPPARTVSANRLPTS